MKAKALPKKTRKPGPMYHYQKPIEPEWKRQKLMPNESSENDDPKSMNENSQDSVINVDKDDSPPAPAVVPTSLATQPNTSAFYPYVDPLHFFIDLRVSAGQANDRKKEAYLQQALKNNNILLDSNTWGNPIIGKNRVGSAFKVPGSINEPNNNFSAINLIASQSSHEAKFYQKQAESSSPSEKGEEDVEIFELPSTTKSESAKHND